jgi:hypothetical protein
MQQMSSSLAPSRGINGRGILSRQDENPVGNANHVFIHYCSSDGWSGTQSDVAVDTFHPRRTEEPIQMRLSFRGSSIVDAVIDTLRQDGVMGSGLMFTLGEEEVAMPDLDDAGFVFFVGASAGGGGVITHVDRVGTLLRAENNSCDDEACPLQFRALIDSSFGPSYETLELSDTTLCT